MKVLRFVRIGDQPGDQPGYPVGNYWRARKYFSKWRLP